MFGMMRRARMTVGRKIYALICLSFIGLLGVAFFGSRELASSLDQQKQIELRHLGELALGIVKEEHAAAQKGGVSEADAQKRAMARLAALRYGNNDYFWINDMHPKMVMHPIKPEMNGSDLSTYKDPNAKLLFVDFVNVVKKDGSGFVPYEWPKPGFDKPQPKLSHVVGFSPWNWVIGTGVYIDDLKAQAWVSTERSLVIAGVVLLFMLVVSIFMARSITSPLQRMTVTMNDLAGGNLAVEVPGIGRGDEIGEMAKAVEVFKSNAVARVALEAEQRAAETRAVASRKADMFKMADDFEAAVGRIVETVSFASDQLEVSAGTLTATAERSEELATTVAAASEEASTNVQSVASATEEMASSVNEISRQVQGSARIAGEAVEQAQKTNDRVAELEGRRPDRRRGGTNQQHRRPDQPAGAQCHHRGGAGRRSRARFCRGGIRSEGAGRTDGEGDRRDQPADIGHPGGDPGIGHGHQGDRRYYRPNVRDRRHHRGRGRGAGRGDPGNFPQRAAGRQRHAAGFGQHR